MVPDDYLLPIWRLTPNHGRGIFTVGLDPREAEFVLERGWATLDGVRYRVNLEGCDGTLQGDGRVMVRCEVIDEVAGRRLEREHRTQEPTTSLSPPVVVADWWQGFEASA